MKKKIQILLLLIGIPFLNCNATVKNSLRVSHSNIDKDFPVTEKLKFKSLNKYNVHEERGGCVIDGSILWHFENGEQNFGYCYNLNTGKKLSVIALRGNAGNELSQLEWFKMTGDSVSLYTDRTVIKTFAKKDIINNIPPGNRKCSLTTAPDSILASRMIKLPDGSTLATIRPTMFAFEKAKRNEINKKSVVVFNPNEAKSYETIKYDSFDIGEAKDNELSANDLIKWAYAQGSMEIKNNNTAVFSVNDQFILYTLDLNTGNVLNEKRYTNMQRDGGEMSFTTINDRRLEICSMEANDKYIVCEVDGYFSEEDKNLGVQKKALFVFDWNLNPVKRIDLPVREGGYYRISTDCSSVYFCKPGRNNITLYEANLNLK